MPANAAFPAPLQAPCTSLPSCAKHISSPSPHHVDHSGHRGSAFAPKQTTALTWFLPPFLVCSLWMNRNLVEGNYGSGILVGSNLISCAPGDSFSWVGANSVPPFYGVFSAPISCIFVVCCNISADFSLLFSYAFTTGRSQMKLGRSRSSGLLFGGFIVWGCYYLGGGLH